MVKKTTIDSDAIAKAVAKKVSSKKKAAKKKAVAKKKPTTKKKASKKVPGKTTPAQRRAFKKQRAKRKARMSKVTPQPQDEDPADKGEDKKRGRPTKYRKWYGHRVYEMKLLGATNAEICTLLEISEPTFHEWLGKESHFMKLYKEGGELSLAKVAARLHRTACGYKHKAVHFSAYQGAVTETEYVKHYPPDVTAAKMILYNRAPDKWKPVEAVAKAEAEAAKKANTGNAGPAPIMTMLLDDTDEATRIREAFAELAEKYKEDNE